MKWAGILLPMIFGAIAWEYVPIALWIDMNQGLLAFLGLIAAALVQVIPVTANFLQSDRLTPEEAVRLSAQLTTQQRFWVGLLIATIATFSVVVIVSILKDRLIWDWGRFGIFDVGPAFSACVMFSLSFVLIKITALIGGVMSLQTLRNELVLNAARRAAAEQIQQFQQAQRAISNVEHLLPPGYGSIIRPQPH